MSTIWIPIAISAAYWIMPIDLIPEAFFGPIGYIDDILVTILVFWVYFEIKTAPWLAIGVLAGIFILFNMMKRRK